MTKLKPLPTFYETWTRELALKFYNEAQVLICDLGMRWLDESAFEDIAGYRAVIEKSGPWKRIATREGAKLVKMSKRPFGFTYTMRGATYSVFFKSTGQYGYKRIA